MILETIQKVKLYHILFQIDQDLADQKRANACPYCGDKLHTSNYIRKPRGGPESLSDELLIRHSFCCQSCRRRVLPVSCRFWDRKVYWGIVILTLVTLQQGRVEGYSAGKLMRLFDVSRHTLKRWLTYFRKEFPLSDRWKRIQGYIGFECSPDQIPGAIVSLLIERARSVSKGLIASLHLLLGEEKMV